MGIVYRVYMVFS